MANNERSAVGNNEIDWSKVHKHAERIEQSGIARESIPKDGTSSNYLKMVEPGVYKLRLLPTGNYIENLPWYQVVRHELPLIVGQGDEGVGFCLCWDFIAKNKETVSRPLAKQQKLFKEDSDKYRQYGCPICEFRKELYKAQNKEEANRLGLREKYLWNAIARKSSKDGKVIAGNVYVYSCSKTIGESIVGSLDAYREHKINPLDLRAGYEFQITATGPNNKNRRYSNPMFVAVPVPAVRNKDVSEIIPHDLVEYGLQSFRNYQDTIALLQESRGKLIARMGYSVPGDESSWDEARGQGISPTPHSEMRETFPDEVPRNRKIQREDYESADEFFGAAVPPDDPEVEFTTRRKTTIKKRKKITPIGKPVGKPKPKDDDWGMSNDNDDDDIPF